MKRTHRFAGCVWPPAFLGQTDTVLARDDTAPGEHLPEQMVECAFNFVAHHCVTIETVGHDVDVNVAIAGMTKTGNRKSRLRGKPFREFDKIDNVAARHDHVLI